MGHLIGEMSARSVLCGMSKSALSGSDTSRISSLNSVAVALLYSMLYAFVSLMVLFSLFSTAFHRLMSDCCDFLFRSH